MSGHRYSGWPGAWCLDCGQDDPFEKAIADGDYDPYTESWRDEATRLKWEPLLQRPCPTQGQRLRDPFRKRKEW